MPEQSALYVLSPVLEQAQAIALLLRRRSPRHRLIGVILPGEGRPLRRGAFDTIVTLAEAERMEKGEWLPTGSQSTALLLERGSVELGSITMSPDALRFYDKPWSINAAVGAGVPSPQTWINRAGITGFPVFYKSRAEGGGARGIAINAGELPLTDEDLIYQEIIATPGTYGVAFLASNGAVQAAHIHHEMESYPELGGSAVILERYDDDRLLRHAERLIAYSKFSGWGLAEFKYCPVREDYVFMEINAKFWATSEFAFRNEPAFTRLLFGVEPVQQPCRRAIYMHRAFARGLGFMTTTFWTYSAGADRRYIPGHWEIGITQLLLPRWARALIRKMLRR